MKIHSRLISLVLGTCIAVFGVYPILASKNSSQKDKPTPVQIGVMSERQREHSKLYKKYNSGRKIPELITKEKGVEVEVYRLLPLGADQYDAPFSTPAGEVNRITCSADVVVVGVVKNKASQLTEDQSFLFTDYGFEVQEVLKGTVSLDPNNEITVTRPGGEIVVDSKTVRALDESFQPMTVGSKYVLFLRIIPQTGSYQAIESGESFELNGNKIRDLKRGSLNKLLVEYNPSALIQEIRLAASSRCENKKERVQ
jgi:hypothetical protein